MSEFRFCSITISLFRTNGWILITFCICIDVYKIRVVAVTRYFLLDFSRVMALDRRQNFVYVDFEEMLHMH